MRKKVGHGGFTLIELMLAVAIIVIIVAIAIAALGTSKGDSKHTGADGSAKTINDAITRAYLKGDTNSAIYGENADDINAAATYLKSKGYID